MFDAKIYFRIITFALSSNFPRNALLELRFLIMKRKFSRDTCSNVEKEERIPFNSKGIRVANLKMDQRRSDKRETIIPTAGIVVSLWQ